MKFFIGNVLEHNTIQTNDKVTFVEHEVRHGINKLKIVLACLSLLVLVFPVPFQ